ncbi:MAG: peptide deformylase [Desulfonatronovibrio sp. MSAO_Bac4]|nr:MAG: peptide deformylase [Desulfonatronovibrio sp. MSAO_Bac4]
MVRQLVTYPNDVLCENARPVQSIDDYIKELADDMAHIMYENRGIGLAAPQVGEGLRLVTIDISGPEKREELMVLVNPEIVEKEGEAESEEGCLSVVGYKTYVKRADKVRVKATDLEGKPVEFEADDLLAICLQHEIDHLDGILFIDRISRLKRKFYDKKLTKWLKNKND